MSSIYPELTDPDGRLERRGAWGNLMVPVDFWLETERLWWGWAGGPVQDREVEPGEGLLTEFGALRHTGPEAIEAFARRWGALQFCEHDRPAAHNPYRLREEEPNAVDWCMPMGWYERGPTTPKGASGFDLLTTWRDCATDIAALLRIAARVRDGLGGTAEDWALVYRRTRSAPWWNTSQSGDGQILTRVVNDLVERAVVRPRLLQQAGRIAVQLGGGGLFGAVVVQLMSVVGSSTGPYFCAGCGTSFGLPVSARKPQRGRGAYCPACSVAHMPQRIANRTSRARR